MVKMVYNCVLVRFSGEFGIKSAQTQEYMERILRGNIKNALNASGYGPLLQRLQFIARSARYYLVPKQCTDSDIANLISIVGRIFGISTVSPCFQTSVKDSTTIRTIPAKLMLAYDLFPSKVEIRILDGNKASLDEKTWRNDIYALCEKFSNEDQESDEKAVSDERHPKKKISKKRFQVNQHWEMGPWACRIEKKLEIEVFEQNAYITAERIKSPGGFPLGLEDPLVALVSGGIDSPVAAWLAMRRGAPLIMVIMDSADGSGRPPAPGASVKEKALLEVKVLLEYMKGYPEEPKIFIIPYGKGLTALAEVGNPKGITCLLCKRFMYRIAENIALTHGAKGIITGEILGEQASQTAQNLMILNNISQFPIFRPLIGFDKEEVVERSRQIGTAHVADISQGSCWGVPDHPQTRGELNIVENAEQRAHIETLIEDCMNSMVQISVKEMNAFLKLKSKE